MFHVDWKTDSSVFLISSANSLREEDHRSPEMSIQLGTMIENYDCNEINHIFK